MKNIFIINGSASENSSNHKIIENFISSTSLYFTCTFFDKLKTLPHFSPELSIENTPQEILDFRTKIQNADGIIICTPEYIFSIPSGLKNALEWCVSTTIFEGKPVGIITASANGEKGHEELQLIMKTLMTTFNEETTLLIQGVKGKVNSEGKIIDNETLQQVENFTKAYQSSIK